MNWWGSQWGAASWWGEDWFDPPTRSFNMPLYYDFVLLGSAGIVGSVTPSGSGGEYIIIYRRRRRE